MQTLASTAALARVLAPPVLSLLNNFSSCTKNASKAAGLSKAGLLLFCFAVIRTNSPSNSTHFFERVRHTYLWNILPKSCIIELWFIARRSIVLAPTRCCWPVSVSQSAPRRPQTCAPAAASWRWNGTTAATAAPAWGWSCSPMAALCFPLRCRSRTSGTLSLSVPTCALSGRARAVLTCVRAIRPILRMGPKAKTQPTPLPGTRTPAHWTMCASVRSAF